MGVLLLSIVAALIPALFYVAIICWVDRYEKEPWWLIVTMFFWGAVPSIIVALIFNTILSIPVHLLVSESAALTAGAIFIAPPVEESVKALVLLAILFFWRHEVDSPIDGIVYGAVVGVGFSMVENVFYFVESYHSDGFAAWSLLVFVRAGIFGLNHALFTSMTGLGIGLARTTPNVVVRYVAPFVGWFLAMFLHFFHNFTVSVGDGLFCLLALFNGWGGLFALALIVILVLMQERRWIRRHLEDEVTFGTLSQKQYETTSSGWKRRKAMWGAFGMGLRRYWRTVRFYNLCSELAYKKEHYRKFRTPKNQARVLALRSKVTKLSAQLMD